MMSIPNHSTVINAGQLNLSHGCKDGVRNSASELNVKCSYLAFDNEMEINAREEIGIFLCKSLACMEISFPPLLKGELVKDLGEQQKIKVHLSSYTDSLLQKRKKMFS